MEIHELNTFSGTLGASDYFATDNGEDTSKVSAEEIFAPLNERIDNIIAGTAPSAAEVIDARLGADGVTYASLGTAIRSQFTNAKKDIDGYVFGGGLGEITASNKTHNGITFTVSSTSVTANGTATANAFIDIIKYTPAKTGRYRLKGAPAGGGSGAYIMYVQGTSAYDTGAGVEYTLNAGTTYTIRIIVYNGYTANNKVFTPELTYLYPVSLYTDRVNGVEELSSINDFFLEYAAWQSSGIEVSASRTRVCSQLFRASGTFTISLADFSNYRFSVVQYPLDSSAVFIDSGWKTSAYTVTVDTSHAFAINMSKSDNSEIDSLDEFNLTINSSDGFHWHLATVDDVVTESDKPKTFRPKQYYYDHSFIMDIDDPTESIIIPCESLFNINTSYRLGFNMIEANVKALNDGNYIVCHGGGTNAMYFGTQFVHVDGVTDISGVAFADVNLAWVQANVRYRTNYSKYATYPSTLQDFLYECKKYGMTALVQAIDNNVVRIANEILGKNNWIAYGATRAMTDGMIMQVRNYTNADEIISRCRDLGRPFMYCMGNTLSFSFAQLKEIVEAVHAEGYLIGYVQYYINEAYNQIYKEIGFDFCAATWSVNSIESGNICNLSGDLSFDDFTTTGNVANDVITLAASDTIVPAQTLSSVFLGKGELVVTFSGKIVVYMGKHIMNTFDSSNHSTICVSSFFIDEAPTFTIRASTSSTIKSITYKASKC